MWPAGLFLAPQMVGEALKSGRLVAHAMTAAGFSVTPKPGMPEVLPYITAVQLGSRERMIAFCQAVQACCPVGSYISPTPGALPWPATFSLSMNACSTERWLSVCKHVVVKLGVVLAFATLTL